MECKSKKKKSSNRSHATSSLWNMLREVFKQISCNLVTMEYALGSLQTDLMQHLHFGICSGKSTSRSHATLSFRNMHREVFKQISCNLVTMEYAQGSLQTDLMQHRHYGICSGKSSNRSHATSSLWNMLWEVFKQISCNIFTSEYARVSLQADLMQPCHFGICTGKSSNRSHATSSLWNMLR